MEQIRICAWMVFSISFLISAGEGGFLNKAFDIIDDPDRPVEDLKELIQNYPNIEFFKGGGELEKLIIRAFEQHYDVRMVKILKDLLDFCPPHDRKIRAEDVFSEPEECDCVKKNTCTNCECDPGYLQCDLLGIAMLTKYQDIIDLMTNYEKNGCGTCLAFKNGTLNLTEANRGEVHEIECPESKDYHQGSWRCANNSVWEYEPSECPEPNSTVTFSNETSLDENFSPTSRPTDTSTDKNLSSTSTILTDENFNDTSTSTLTNENFSTTSRPTGTLTDKNFTSTTTGTLTDEKFSTTSPGTLTNENYTPTTIGALTDEKFSSTSPGTLTNKNFTSTSPGTWMKENFSSTSAATIPYENECEVLKTELEHLHSNIEGRIDDNSSEIRSQYERDLKNITGISGHLKELRCHEEVVSDDVIDSVAEMSLEVLAHILPNSTDKFFVPCMVENWKSNSLLNKSCNNCTHFGPSVITYGISTFREVEKTLTEFCGKCLAQEHMSGGHSVLLEATAHGGNFQFPCFGKFKSSTATWKCTSDSMWDDAPDLSQCRNLSVEDILKKKNDTISEMSPTEETILISVSIKDMELLPGDTLMVVNLLKNIAELKNQSKSNIDSEKYFRALLEVNEKFTEVQTKYNTTKDDAVEALRDIIVPAALTMVKQLGSTAHSGNEAFSNATFLGCMSQIAPENTPLNDTCRRCSSREASNTASNQSIIGLLEKTMKERCGICLGKEQIVNDKSIFLKSTSRGSLYHFNCPNGIASHSASWRCKDDTTWDLKPNMSECEPTFEESKILLAEIASVFEVNQNITREEKVDIAEEIAKKIDKSLNRTEFEGSRTEAVNKKSFDNYVNMMDKIYKFMAPALSPNEILYISRDNIDIKLISQSVEFFKSLVNRRYIHKFDSTTRLELPKHFYESASLSSRARRSPGIGDEDQVVVGFMSSINLHCVHNVIPCEPNEADSTITAKSQIISSIIGASVGNSSWKAVKNEYVKVIFSHIYDGNSYRLSNIHCAWWNVEANDHSTEGCWLEEGNETITICHCDHLTNLYVIMDIYGDTSVQEGKILSLITIIGCTCSIFCLMLTIASLWLMKKERMRQVRNRSTKTFLIKIHLCVSLSLFLILLLLGSRATQQKVVCAIIAALLHFLILSAFTWSAINSFNIYQKLFEVTSDLDITAKIYFLVGYCLPLLLVLLTLATTFGKGYGTDETDEICWLDKKIAIWIFLGSLVLFLLVNTIAFGISIYRVWQESLEQSKFRHIGGSPPDEKEWKMKLEKMKSRLVGPISIFLTLGLTWIFGFLALIKGVFSLKVIFTVLNSLQGTGIFVFEVLLNERHRKTLVHYLDRRAKISETLRNCRSCQGLVDRTLSRQGTSSSTNPNSTVSVAYNVETDVSFCGGDNPNFSKQSNE